MDDQQGLLTVENIVTVLIGIAILAFIFLLLYNLRLARHRIVELESELLKKNKQIRDAHSDEIKRKQILDIK